MPAPTSNIERIRRNRLYHCNILSLLSIVFVPNANNCVPTGQVIFIFAFRAYLYAFFSYGFVVFETATNPVEQIVLRTYPGSVLFLPDHSGGISVKSCVTVFNILFSFLHLLLLYLFSLCL